jgi:hypothetical protein
VGRKTYFLVAGVIFAGCGVPCASDLYGVAYHDCELVSTEIGELDCLILAGGLALFAFRFITENGEH